MKNSKAFKDSISLFINMTDSFGKTALHYAVANDNVSNVKLLLGYKAGIYIRDSQNRKPLDMVKSKEIY